MINKLVFLRNKLGILLVVAMLLSLVPSLLVATPAEAAGTTSITVTKYDAYGNVISTVTHDYLWMEANLPVQGNGETNYFCQGPTFDNSTFNTAWDPDELVNVDSRNYGEKGKGTDVKDLCDLVGGASPGDSIRIKAVDNMYVDFDYESIYNPPPTMGKFVVTWYAFGGYVPGFSSGIRLMWFVDPSTANSLGQLSWGHYDMHETLPQNRWYYYSNINPSSGGKSAKYTNRIEIREPNLVSCDAAGNYQDSFLPGETVYVKGLGMAKSTNYKLWIQNEPITAQLYDSIDIPIASSTYSFNTANDPSGAQESITTDANGDFAPTVIYTIDSGAAPHKYDIVADNQGSGVGVYGTGDFIDNPGYKGFLVTPDVSPEISAIAGVNGSISPGGTTVTYGDSQWFTITPDTGFHIADVVIDGVSVGPISKYYFSNVTADHSITASFAHGGTWYLDNNLTMENTSGTQSNVVNLQKGASRIWLSDAPADDDITIGAGDFIVSLRTSDWGTGGCTAEIGTSNGGVFTPFASSGVADFSYSDGGFLIVTIPTSDSETVPDGNYLALKITNNSSSTPGYRDIATDGASFLALPDSDPGFPIPEIATFALLGLGLAGLAGYMILRYRKSQNNRTLPG